MLYIGKMKTVKVASNVSGLKVISFSPSFKYTFEKVGEPIEVPEDHAKKMLKNGHFYVSDKPIKKGKKMISKEPKQEKPWLQELEEIKGIGKKSAKDVVAVYPTRGSLLEAISIKAHIPFPENTVKLLQKEFIH